MGHQVTIGGERLGAGKRNKVTLHNYERSTHDLSYVWRSTMAAGTLVPFMTELALPGDTFDINLNCDVLTHPTIGPLFGSYKIQLDVFQVPVRLYQGKLHMNMLGIGMDMSKVPLPQLQMYANGINALEQLDNQHINPSSIWSYLGIRGLGFNQADVTAQVARQFNAIPYLGYWDIYKNYYANKQEEIGAVIHKNTSPLAITITQAQIKDALPDILIPLVLVDPVVYAFTTLTPASKVIIEGTGITDSFDPTDLLFLIQTTYWDGTPFTAVYNGGQMFKNWAVYPAQGFVVGTSPNEEQIPVSSQQIGFGFIIYASLNATNTDTEPEIVTFPLKNIDTMRQNLLSHFLDTPYLVAVSADPPYGLALDGTDLSPNPTIWAKTYSQEGLALKTYNSDLFNNWISTEWIDGVDGISAVTAIDTTGGSFTIDELNLSRKIYDMLNRIAISGGSYDDWLDAVYTHERQRSAENPMYLGGLIKNLVFQEVVSNSQTIDQPLGTLAGRGRIGDKNKGGKIVVKVDEPSYIMGIISLTPNVDYSQGNKWDMNLATMNDLHKPALDEIGFQDLITDQMAWYDTPVDVVTFNPIYKSAGKQPAWINYMTNINVVKGNFADQNQQMFMVLNRRYGTKFTGGIPSIKDLTTYIDPTKFNHIFANTRRDAQNFWAQIGVNIEARRKMSAKVIPNL